MTDGVNPKCHTATASSPACFLRSVRADNAQTRFVSGKRCQLSFMVYLRCSLRLEWVGFDEEPGSEQKEAGFAVRPLSFNPSFALHSAIRYCPYPSLCTAPPLQAEVAEARGGSDADQCRGWRVLGRLP